MDDYDLKVEKNTKRNEKFINGFSKWLENKNLGDKTIRKHLSNADLYINNYLTYYDITEAEKGISEVYSFLDDWFIRKCLWSSVTSIKETAASIKKFYQYMSESGYVTANDYKELCEMLKDSMDDFLYSMRAYEDMDFDF